MKTIPILNIEQFEKDKPSLNDFYSNDLKTHLIKNKNLIHKPHKHDFYLCILFTKGTGTHEIDFNRYEVKPGCVFFLKPGQTHSWILDENPAGYIFFHTQKFYEFNFSNQLLNQFPFYDSLKNSPKLILSKSKTLEFANKFKELNTEYYQKENYQEFKITSIINLIYIDFSRLYLILKPKEINSSIRYIETLKLLETEIEKCYCQEKSAKFYAEKLNISAKHLNRIVKTTVNKTTTELISERVLLEAKRLIVHSNNSLSNIAEILGFEDYAYFSKQFKAKTKITPMSFKNKYTNKKTSQ